MTLLTPFGLLGLLGIVALIIIYIIKPNYQNKMISSTFIWKMSLKYRKKSIPISKLRNFLIIFCQILIIALCAMLLTQPFIPSGITVNSNEKIVVIDASANMLTVDGGKTRFARAVESAKSLAEEVESADGVLTVILADGSPSYLVQRCGAEAMSDVYDMLDDLAEDSAACTYGAGDIDGAMALAQYVLDDNPEAEVYFYTATTYYDKGGVNVVNVSEESEWNLAVLDCTAEFSEGYYVFTVQVVCYNKDIDVDVYIDVQGANSDNSLYTFRGTARCENDSVQTLVFSVGEGYEGIYTYEWARVYVEENDSFSYDNSFYLYGGTKQTVRVQYYSSEPNTFFSSVLMGLSDMLQSRWNLLITQVKESGEPEAEGYDIYIFEHQIPETLPTDGVVLLIDPDRIPKSVDLTLGAVVPGSFEFSNGAEHPITNSLDFTDIIVTEYTRIVETGEFESLLYCAGDPILLVKNTEQEKILVLPFSLNQSDLAVSIQFPILFYNIFNYFLPSASDSYVYEVDDVATLNARGASLTVTGPSGAESEFEELSALLALTVPGVYTLYQVLMSGTEVIDNFYVRIPAEQSNIFRVADVLNAPVVSGAVLTEDYRLLIYFAAAMVALLFVEWLLQSKGQM